MVRISKKKFEWVVSKVAGEDVVPLARFLKNKRDVSEFELADEIGAEINITRNMLYRLHQANLVTSIRRKDEEKGWYIYYWSFKAERIPLLVKQIKRSKLRELKDKLNRETNGVLFLCRNECVVLDFDQALNFNFRCPECGLVMNHKENCKEHVNTLRCKIKNLEEEIV